MPDKQVLSNFTQWLKKSVWTFPLILLFLLFFLTVFKIHGSSIGIYYSDLHGSSENDPDLLFGSPRSIRSDEFRGRTPIKSHQVKDGYSPKTESKSKNSRTVFSFPFAPVANWTALFKPQTWAYFVLPLENAFAFSWWFILFFFIITAYFFILKILPRRRLLASALSLSFGLSPFFFWWFQVNSLMPFGLAFLALIIAIKIIKKEKIPFIKSGVISDAIYALLLGWVGIAYGLIIYVPFLLPIFLVVLVFLLGFIAENHPPRKELIRYLGIAIPAFLIILTAGFVFYSQNSESIKNISKTVYPGQRSVESGGQKIISVLDGFTVSALQSNGRAVNYYTNQSEASNFILLLPFLLVPGFIILYIQYRKNKRIGWSLLIVQVIAVIFLLRMFVHFGDPLYELFLLDRVPHNRLLAGLGFAGFLQLILIIRSLDVLKINKKMLFKYASVYSLFVFAALITIGRHIQEKYPGYLDEFWIMLGLAFFFVAIIYSFLAKKFLLAASLLLVFSFASVYKINPLYKELNLFDESDVIKKIQRVSDEDSSWITIDSMLYGNLPFAAGRNMISGQQSGTNTDFWKEKNKDPKFNYTYNRQAHALFISNTLKRNPSKEYNFSTIEKDFEYVKGNVFKVKFECDEFTYKYIDFVLAVSKLNFPCLKQVEKSEYPKKVFYIYEVEKN